MGTWTKVSNVESLYQHSNGRYYVRLYGGQDSFRSLRTKKISVAKQRLRDYLANRPPPGRIAEEATLEELFDRFLRHPDFGLRQGLGREIEGTHPVGRPEHKIPDRAAEQTLPSHHHRGTDGGNRLLGRTFQRIEELRDAGLQKSLRLRQEA